MSGDPIVRASLAGTAVFAVVAVAAAALPDDLAPVAVVVDLLLFAAGVVAFAAALVKAAARSRTSMPAVPDVFLLTGSAAPPEVRRPLLAALGVEVVVAFATAGVRPFTGLAFGVLVPVYGLGLAGLWGARHGTFPPRS